ncbi:glutaredoxin family protein [Shewanella sp. Scap07]|uniref:glutaredoxin family protein n=1 Tax=Shewanella sp. Scap07 TaxID=2589987 RepID=UPI0015B94065|nr:glutaredoxin family protein [Shewanella sp. Scap07]QLE85387.1 glutaredoxin family protein [Shewanella sp. Scap07]
MSQPQLVLFHTEHCHLCEQAAALLQGAGLSYTHVDICDDPHLAERYGISIPVLQRVDSQLELCWPFDLPQIQAFLGV